MPRPEPTFVVIGANGFIGTNFLSYALTRGAEVRGVVRSKESAEPVAKLGAKCFLCPKYAVEELCTAMRGADVVVHLIAIGRGSPEQLMEVNARLLGRVLAAAKQEGIARIIYVSGLGVDTPYAEQSTYHAYFASKAEAEREVKQSGMPYFILRPSFVVGSGDYLLTTLMKAIGEGRVFLPGTGTATNRIQPIFIQDVVQAVYSCGINQHLRNETYDLIGPDSVTVQDLIAAIYNAIATAEVNISQPLVEEEGLKKARSGRNESLDFLEVPVLGNSEKIMADLGLHFTPLAETIAKTVNVVLDPYWEVPPKRAVLLFSGGLDSVTTLYWTIQEGFEVIPVTMHYFERPLREILAMREHMRRLNLRLIEVPAGYLKEVFQLKMEGYPVPSIFGAGEAYVPYRNLIFNAIATYFADVHGARYIISGHIVSDPLPDANQAFFDALEMLVRQLKVGKKAVAPKFLLPLKGKSKFEVVKMSIDLNVPTEWTWSCEFDGARPCGKCKPCQERADAFKQFGIPDPVAELDVPDWRDVK